MYSETQIINNAEKISTLAGQPGEEGELVINVGPQHPATHGVLHLVIT